MKSYHAAIAILFFFACNSSENKKIQSEKYLENGIVLENEHGNDSTSGNIYINDTIFINLNLERINIARLGDDDMNRNTSIIYRSEGDVIENIDEIKIADEILNKPFDTNNISILSENSNKIFLNGIEELMGFFDINIPENIVKIFNTSEPYKNTRIVIGDLELFVYRVYDNNFKLFSVEYKNNGLYDPRIKIGYSKEDITKILGDPSAYSDERNMYIYYSNRTLRQINIFFENDKINYVQLISWGGI
jgi:hypothetical protein